MKFRLYNVLPLFLCFLVLPHEKVVPPQSPLTLFSEKWNDEKYLRCNTAATVPYLSNDEKNLIYILNLLRADPTLFANSVLLKYPDHTSQTYLRDINEYKSLTDTLRKLKPLPLLSPDSLCFASARCHAITSGQSGYVGHVRTTRECSDNRKFFAECCDYGHTDPLDIVMSLLIDQGVPSLGHRYACLGSYTKIGVSIQPHKIYSFNSVLDFYY